ncbi:DinB family protein [Ferruginibacter sp.]|nr:DUF1569 domain-containing protein [Ferruginibacter sp.]
MNVYQMLLHCSKWEEMALGKKNTNKHFLVNFFGKMALKDFIKDETPFKRNVPTVPEFKIKEKVGNFKHQKSKWINLISEYEHFDNPEFEHPFGKMTKEQVGLLAYKHTDHHLRQFKKLKDENNYY